MTTTLSARPASEESDASLVSPAGACLGLGAAGVVLTSLFYLLSPPHAAMPVVPPDLNIAAAGAIDGAATMRLAGLTGIPADMLITAGGLVLGLAEGLRGRGVSALGWFLIALSTVIFAIVDALVGFVLPQAAISAPASFPAAKLTFDILFVSGTFAFGTGAVLAVLPRVFDGYDHIPRLVSYAALAFGAISAASAIGYIFGMNTHHFMGIGIAGGALSFALIGVAIAYRSRP
jgi:hypothetical protein